MTHAHKMHGKHPEQDQSVKEEIEEKVEELPVEKTKEEELTESLQRLQAEFENYRRRVQQEMNDSVKFASVQLIKKLLPIVDSIEHAKVSEKDDKEYAKGARHIFQQLNDVLKKEGLQKINETGVKFNPYIHQALITEEADEKDIILQILQPGYKVHDKVIEHAKVKVSK
ncbi:nucleotide exchange factor GrpE [Candidatus Woesearchaeota archaeon]|nr:nucleotide exchange factor GrpE [Candidatus Woesearchaeota archaeon]